MDAKQKELKNQDSRMDKLAVKRRVEGDEDSIKYSSDEELIGSNGEDQIDDVSGNLSDEDLSLSENSDHSEDSDHSEMSDLSVSDNSSHDDSDDSEMDDELPDRMTAEALFGFLLREAVSNAFHDILNESSDSSDVHDDSDDSDEDD